MFTTDTTTTAQPGVTVKESGSFDLSGAKLADVDTKAGWEIDVSRGSVNGTISRQWASRPDDQRFLTMDDLRAHVAKLADESRAAPVPSQDIRVIGSMEDPESLSIALPMHVREWGGDVTVELAPTHYAFGQLASLAGAPAGYLRELPSSIAAINLQYGLTTRRAENVKAYVRRNGTTELRAVTGPDYGRILDRELVDALHKLAGNGTTDSRWKVPGVIDWRTGRYMPEQEVTKDSTTLYASDRDVFVFLVDDLHPIEIGKLPNGQPDIVFRGIYAWNSEVGARSCGIAAMLYRGSCQNRNAWGVQGFREITLRHTQHAPHRFASLIAPEIERLANSSTAGLLEGIDKARGLIVGKTEEDQLAFLGSQKFTRSQAEQIIRTSIREEGKPPASAWDMVQAITAAARKHQHQDERVAMERTAGRIMEKATK